MIEDLDLVKKVKAKQCDESLNALVNKHSPLVFRIYRKYARALSDIGVTPDDISQQQPFLVWKAAERFNPKKKSKFSSWLGDCVKWYCLNSLNSANKYAKFGRTLSLPGDELSILIDKHTKPEPPKEELSVYVFSVLNSLKEKRIKDIFWMRYMTGGGKLRPWEQIAKSMDMSVQGVINLHDKGKKLLKAKMTSDQGLDLT